MRKTKRRRCRRSKRMIGERTISGGSEPKHSCGEREPNPNKAVGVIYRVRWKVRFIHHLLPPPPPPQPISQKRQFESKKLTAPPSRLPDPLPPLIQPRSLGRQNRQHGSAVAARAGGRGQGNGDGRDDGQVEGFGEWALETVWAVDGQFQVREGREDGGV